MGNIVTPCYGKWKLGLILVFLFLPIVNAVPCDKDVNYYGDLNGRINFNSDFTTTEIDWVNGLIMIDSFVHEGNTKTLIGFDCSSNANMTVRNATSTYIRYDVEAPTGNISTTKVYIGGSKYPGSVEGADSWHFDTVKGIVTVYAVHASPVTITINLDETTDVFKGAAIATGFLILIVLIPLLGILMRGK